MGVVAEANLSPQEQAEFEVLENMGKDIEGCLMLRFKSGWTALQIAIDMFDDPSIIQGLAAANADMNAVFPNDYTSPLVFSLRHIKINSAKALIGCNANVNDADSPLFYAVSLEDEEIIKMLIERGADVNDGGRYTMTPLHAACGIQSDKREKIILMLIEAGADTTLRNASGQTAADLYPGINEIAAKMKALDESSAMAAKRGITLGSPQNRRGSGGKPL